MPILKLFLFFQIICLEACEFDKATSDRLFISLGCNCDVAVQLRDRNLREEAFPFDWLNTSNHDRISEILDDDFQYFVEEDCLFQNENRAFIENRCYEIEFRHENILRDLKNDLDEIATKYKRRIDRFRELRNYKGKVFFIRTAYHVENSGKWYWYQDSHRNISVDQAKTLHEALERFFPFLDFTLVIINFKEEKGPKIENISGVLEFKIRKDHKTVDYMRLISSLSA